MTAGPDTGTGTIEDDDETDIALSVAPSSVAEGAAATSVTVTAKTDGDTFKTPGPDGERGELHGRRRGDGDRRAPRQGTDYTTVADFKISPSHAGQTSGEGTFTLTPTDDKIVEGEEKITVSGTATDLTVNGTSVKLTDDDSTDIALSVDRRAWRRMPATPR